MEGKLNAIYFLDEFCKPRRDNRTQFVPVDLWTPANENEVIINCKPGFFIAPLSIIFGLNIDPNDKLNYFMLSTKKCYNSADMFFLTYHSRRSLYGNAVSPPAASAF